jgi:hypothetical protein
MNVAKVVERTSSRGQDEVDEKQKLVDVFVAFRNSDYEVEISVNNVAKLISSFAD